MNMNMKRWGKALIIALSMSVLSGILKMLCQINMGKETNGWEDVILFALAALVPYYLLALLLLYMKEQVGIKKTKK